MTSTRTAKAAKNAASTATVLLTMSFLLSSFPPSGAAPPAPPTGAGQGKAVNPAGQSLTLDQDPNLQQRVTIDAVDRPLGDVLSSLSSELKVDLVASSDNADQRVTIHATDQPVFVLMTRLKQILSHSPTHPHGYYWGSLDRAKGTRPGILFWRDAHSRSEDQDALDEPRRKMAILLRDLRDLSRMTPEQRDNYHGAFPKQYFADPSTDEFRDALAAMSDDDLDALMSGQHVPLDPTHFAGRIAAYQQMQQAAGGLPAPPPAIYVKVDDRDGDDPAGLSLYGIFLDGISTVPPGGQIKPGTGYFAHIQIDPSQPNTLLPAVPPDIPRGGPIYDLTPTLMAKAVTGRQRQDLGFTLRSLAATAHINLYQEAFFKPAISGLSVMKGTLAQLLSLICVQWDCHVEKTGDDYVVWNRHWAQDRADDVPQRKIDEWRGKIRTGIPPTALRSDIAATLTWPQVRLTLYAALPEAGDWGTLSNYNCLRLLGNLTPEEGDLASSSTGLPLSNMLPWQQQDLAQDFSGPLSKATIDQVSQSALTILQEPTGPNGELERTTIQVVDGQQVLAKKIMVFPARFALPPNSKR